jgi:hypothetical protein
MSAPPGRRSPGAAISRATATNGLQAAEVALGIPERSAVGALFKNMSSKGLLRLVGHRPSTRPEARGAGTPS